MTTKRAYEDLPIDQYLEQSCMHVYVSDLLRLVGGNQAVNGHALACSYFCAVAKGQHIFGREFTYASQTLWNRQSFLHAAKGIFDQTTSRVDALTLQDLHSLLLLLCPDMPVRVARSAFKAATPLLPSGASVPHALGDVLKLSVYKLWSSLEVTFLYEHFLLELRHLAFDGKSHLLRTAADIDNVIQPASEIVARTGWPCIPETILQDVMQQIADVAEASASFHFDALVRGLCNSTSLHRHLSSMREQVLAKRYNARDILDIALQLLVPSKAPLEDKTNTATRSPSNPSFSQPILDIVDFGVDDECC